MIEGKGGNGVKRGMIFFCFSVGLNARPITSMERVMRSVLIGSVTTHWEFGHCALLRELLWLGAVRLVHSFSVAFAYNIYRKPYPSSQHKYSKYLIFD